MSDAQWDALEGERDAPPADATPDLFDAPLTQRLAPPQAPPTAPAAPSGANVGADADWIASGEDWL